MASNRNPLVPALVVLTAFMASSSDRAGATDRTPAPQKRPGASTSRMSAAVASRLRAAGLDPANPQLGQKLRQRFEASRNVLLPRTGLVTKRMPQKQSAKRAGSPPPTRRLPDALRKARPVTSVGPTSLSIQTAQLDAYLLASLIVTAPKPYTASDITYRLTEPICGLDVSGSMECWEEPSDPWECDTSGKGTETMELWALPSKPLAFGAKLRDVTLMFSAPGLPSVTQVLPGISGSKDLVYVSLTIDASPPHVPTNDLGIQQKDCHLGGSGARASTGEPWLPTAGEDTLAIGVNLGTGYTVQATEITAAHSQLDGPNYMAPEDPYRYARIKTKPVGNRITTVVEWMYGPAESLTYTIRWTLQGPAGQRPLMTMPLRGSCDS
jgi:hypothetical protein